MRKLLGAAIVVLAMAGCAAPPNTEPCKEFVRQANTSMEFALDLSNDGDIKSADAVMSDLPDVLAEHSAKASGAPQEAMSIFVVSVTLFNSGGTVKLRDRLDTVRDACSKDGVSF